MLLRIRAFALCLLNFINTDPRITLFLALLFTSLVKGVWNSGTIGGGSWLSNRPASRFRPAASSLGYVTCLFQVYFAAIIYSLCFNTLTGASALLSCY